MAAKAKGEKSEDKKATEHERFLQGEEHRKEQAEARKAEKDKSDES